MSAPGTLDRLDQDHLTSLYSALLNQDKKTTEVAEEQYVKQLSQIISQLLDQAPEQRRTGKLWVHNIRQVSLLQCFIPAERTGDWKLHLNCVTEMIPHFHAAGHLPYAKSARLHLIQMEALEKTMPGNMSTHSLQKTDTSLFAVQNHSGVETTQIRPLNSS